MMVDAKLMTVVQAIKQSIETSGTPGLSVNSHPNPFFLNVNGALDLQRAAELVLIRLATYDESVKAKFEADVEKVRNLILAEKEAGAVNIEDAMERIKARVELLVTSGATEAGIERAKTIFMVADAPGQAAYAPNTWGGPTKGGH